MTDEGRAFRRGAREAAAPQVAGPAVKRKDARAKSLPTAPVRERASGKYRQKQGGRRGQ